MNNNHRFILCALMLMSLPVNLLVSLNASAVPNNESKSSSVAITSNTQTVDVEKWQAQLDEKNRQLLQVNEQLKLQENQNLHLQQQLEQMQSEIQRSNSLIENQNSQMNSQNARFEKTKRERSDLQREVEERNTALSQQRDQLQRISNEIGLREKRLTELNSTIVSQEAEIARQKSALETLGKTVGVQNTALKYLWGLVILGILLIGTAVIAYSMKQQDNQRLAARTKDLQIARDRLAIAKRKAEAASKAKSDFLSLMSHELRTPLQSIIGYSELLIEELKLESKDSYTADLMRVIQNGERLLKLINSVLDLAKIESGAMVLDLTDIKLSSLVDEAIGSVRPLFEKNQVSLNFHVNDGVRLPKADPEKLLHILINLLGNACKFSPNGQVTLIAKHEKRKIYISVADTGIGLALEQQAKIFEPFRQADSGITRKFDGSGLGLSIARQFCELMGGSIYVESELGKGANFIVEIPLPIKPQKTFSEEHDDVTEELMG